MAIEARAALRGRTARAPREPSYRLRVLALLTVALLAAGIIWARLAYWQVVEHKRLAADALTQYSKVVELPATRGMIYDRNGQALAINETVYSIVIAPDQVRASQREHVAAALSAATGKPLPAMQALVSSRSQFAYVARRFEADPDRE